CDRNPRTWQARRYGSAPHSPVPPGSPDAPGIAIGFASAGRSRRRRSPRHRQLAFPSKSAMPTLALLGTVLGLSFTSGLNLYATVLATGLFLRLGWIVLPPAAAPLGVLAHPAVVITAGVLYVLEFLADKVPVVD